MGVNRKNRVKGVPSVRFTPTGKFAFNMAATAQFENEAIGAVLLMWDAGNKLVGVRPISAVKKDKRAYNIRIEKKGNGSGFSAITFFKHIGYDSSHSRTLPIKWDDSEGIFIIEVPNECFLR